MRGLVSEEQCEALIQDRITSRQWWIIIAASERSYQLAASIEEHYYSTPEAAKKFDLAMMPRPSKGVGIVAIFMAAKEYMTRADLQKIRPGSLGHEESDVLTTLDISIELIEWLSAKFNWD